MALVEQIPTHVLIIPAHKARLGYPNKEDGSLQVVIWVKISWLVIQPHTTQGCYMQQGTRPTAIFDVTSLIRNIFKLSSLLSSRSQNGGGRGLSTQKDFVMHKLLCATCFIMWTGKSSENSLA